MKKKQNKIVVAVRWLGRLTGSLMAVLMLAYFFDEGLSSFMKFETPQLPMFIAFFVILSGYIVAWWKESVGALLVIGGAVFFWSLNAVGYSKLWMGWFIFVFPLTALPFIYCWWKEK